MEVKKPVIVDTDFLSHYLGARKSALYAIKELIVKGFFPVTTVITTAEMYYGAYKKGWGKKRMEKMGNFLSKIKILAFTEESSIIFGRLRAKLVKRGLDIGFADIAITAIALTEKIPVLTGNISHFNRFEELDIIEYLL